METIDLVVKLGFLLLVLWIFRDSVKFGINFFGQSISVSRAMKHSIPTDDMMMIVDAYTQVIGKDFYGDIAAHVLNRTKKYLDGCLDRNHIPKKGSVAYSDYLEDTFQHIHSGIFNRLCVAPMLNDEAAERLKRVVVQVFERNC